MIELPEAFNLSYQLRATVLGKTVRRVLPPNRAHKFCWFNGEPQLYDGLLKGSELIGCDGYGIFVEPVFSNGLRLCINDGVNPSYLKSAEDAGAYQLLIEFTNGDALVFTVAMYGGIYLHDGNYDNEYYKKSKNFISPFTDGFEKYFWGRMEECKPNYSAKAFIATEQRFPGIGNGVAQDILFRAGIHPKRKLKTLGASEKENLFGVIVSVLLEMTQNGGRDTEKDLFGNKGGYHTIMSKNNTAMICPVCGTHIVKEAYLGGSVYYCPVCQPLVER